MLFSFLTVLFYSASSLGDKFISAKLNCCAREFSLLVSLATAFFSAVAFKLSRIIPSGVSGIFSIADNTFTPLSRNAFLCIAVSYLFRENRSSL